jgi:large subunit ribosomal protein L35
MSKLKTKSSAKKRFRLTASGLVKMGKAGRRHGMRKRTNDMLRDSRGSAIMEKADAKRVKDYYLHG